MHRFWDTFIEPLLEVVRPRCIVEIGSDRGDNTRRLLAWCASHEAVLHVIDPLPKYDPEAWKVEYGDRLIFHQGLSLNQLPEVGAAELVLIDGDHNWYTVFHELQMIERRMKALKAPMPCLLLHDVGWPYGRRDLYYDPATVPEKHRKPYARKGLRLGSHELVDDGGMNPHLDHGLYENDKASGVLTAIEDYLKKTRQPFCWIHLEGIHGLGVLIPEKMIQGTPDLEAFAAQWALPESVAAFQQAIEHDRIRIETQRQIERRKVLEQTRLLREKDEQAETLQERLAVLDAHNREAAEALRDWQERLARSEEALRNQREKGKSIGLELEDAHHTLEIAQADIERMRLAAERDRQTRIELEKTEIGLRERSHYLEERLRENREETNALQAELKAAQAQINEAVREKCQQENAVRDLEIALEEASRNSLQLEKRIGDLEGERQNARRHINELEGRMAEASRQQEIARRQLQEKSQEVSRLAYRLEEADHKGQRLQEEIAAQAAAQTSLAEAARVRDNEHRGQLDRLRIEKSTLMKAVEDLRAELGGQGETLAEARAKQADLQVQLEAQERAREEAEECTRKAINDKERWEHALRAQREDALAARIRHERELMVTGQRVAAEEQKNLRQQEELLALRERETQLEKDRRALEKLAHSNRLDLRRFYFGQQLALTKKSYVAVDFLSQSSLLRRIGVLSLSVAKRVAPGLRDALSEAKKQKDRLARQKALERRKGYQQRVEKFLGIAANKKSRQKKPKISVIAWDVGHNPLGRAYLLADLFCNRSYDAELIGAQFPRYGNDIWPPLKNLRIPLQRFTGRMFPEHFADLERMAAAIDGDVIYVAKPRIPSLLLGILAKMQRNRPLVLDIDDYELAFFKDRRLLTLDELKAAPRDKDFLCPHDNLWTRYAETLAAFADHITVSNSELQKKYGGTILPHVRNGEHFNPALYDRDTVRKGFGFVPEDRVILFIGTPRMHKGFLEIIDALERIDNSNYKLCIIGTVVDREVRQRLDAVAGDRIRCFPDSPFEDLPKNLCVGDLICILQDPAHMVSAYQMPAKVTDALSMGIPVLASDVAPLKNLARQGLVELPGGRPLAEVIDLIFRNYPQYKAKAEDNRIIFGREYAYVANRDKLWSVFNGLIGNTPPVASEFRRCVEFMRAEFCGAQVGTVLAVPVVKPEAAPPAERQPESAPIRSLVDDKINIVFFWKQNDSDLYGRRQDMMVKYLAAHPQVNKIIHFDAPIEYGAWMRLMNFSKDRKYDQRGLIFRHTLKRLLGLGDKANVIRKTYVYMGRQDRRNYIADKLFGPEGGYLAYVRKILDRHRVWDRRTVFWVCPANFQFPQIREAFNPDLVVADVIDDQRKWPCREKYRQRLHENYGEILTASDLVIANCDNVVQSMSEFRQQVRLIPNACEYFNGRLPSFTRPSVYRKMRGPIIGYVGNLDASRLDLELLDYLARKRPEWQFVMIGSLHMNQDILELRKHENVHFLGVIPYEKALSYIRHFDVAIIPHIDNGMTQVMNPLKTYVYCALDVPVVSTAIMNLDAMEALIHVAHSRSTFMKKIELCLKTGKRGERSEAIDILLKNNSWQRRVDEVITHVLDHPLMAKK